MSHYCIYEVQLLDMEGTWLLWLILAQLFKTAVLSVWHLALNRRKHPYFADQFDVTFSDDTTMTTMTTDHSKHQLESTTNTTKGKRSKKQELPKQEEAGMTRF